MVFRWASAPSYAPLYTNLSAEDASAVVEQLEADGVAYEIGGGGGTISVPRDQVYATRIALSGEGIPAGSTDTGYALLDGQDISTSQFKEQTDFKRAMEGELAATIEAIDGVTTAVVHLALPPKQVFAEEQDPATASVLVDTRAGTALAPRPGAGRRAPRRLQHRRARPRQGHRRRLDGPGALRQRRLRRAASAAAATARSQDYQDQLGAKAQSMLDRVFGPGNSSVQVTAVLDFDKVVRETTTYGRSRNAPTLSESVQNETYSGSGAPGGASGVVGPDTQLETGAADGDGSYNNSSTVRENGIDKVVEQSETAPGSVESLHAAVVIDTNSEVAVDASRDRRARVVGDRDRPGAGRHDRDVQSSRSTPRPRTPTPRRSSRPGRPRPSRSAMRGSATVPSAVACSCWSASPGCAHGGSAQAREDATTYVVEQLRQEQVARAALQTTPSPADAPTALALAPVVEPVDGMRDELVALVERQPDEVAALLRGWLVERP